MYAVRMKTNKDVYAALLYENKDVISVYSYFSDPDGTVSGKCQMETIWCIKGCDLPFLGACTEWDYTDRETYARIGEQSEYWVYTFKEEKCN